MIRTHQSKRAAFIESITDKVSGAVITTLLAIPWFNVGMDILNTDRVTFLLSVSFTVLMFIVAVGRSYLIRRLFDRMPVILRWIRRRKNTNGI